MQKRSVLKVAIAAVAVVGGSFLGAAIGVPMLSLAQSDGETGTPSAVDNAVERATDPAAGTSNGRVAPAAQAGDAEKPAGPHAVGDCTEESLSAENEAKVKAAVEKEVPGATIERIETECDGNGVYEAHLTKSDGTRATAFLNESFEVTSVQDGGPGGPGHRGPGGRGPGVPAPQDDTTTDSNA